MIPGGWGRMWSADRMHYGWKRANTQVKFQGKICKSSSIKYNGMPIFLANVSLWCSTPRDLKSAWFCLFHIFNVIFLDHAKWLPSCNLSSYFGKFLNVVIIKWAEPSTEGVYVTYNDGPCPVFPKIDFTSVTCKFSIL